MAAMSEHSGKRIQALLAAGANIEVCDKKEAETILHDAVNNKRVESVSVLLKEGADIEARNIHNRTPLAQVIFSDISNERDLEIIRILLEKGANVYAQDNNGFAINDTEFASIREAMDSIITPWKEEYKEFMYAAKVPANAAQVYHYLAVMPLLNPGVPVDYACHIKQIFLHAKWQNKLQAQKIIDDIQKDGLINTETAESILSATFPQERSHAILQQPNVRRR